jgi:hypothetical protein
MINFDTIYVKFDSCLDAPSQEEFNRALSEFKCCLFEQGFDETGITYCCKHLKRFSKFRNGVNILKKIG